METYFGEIEQTCGRLVRERLWADVRALVRDSETLLRATAHDVSDKTRDARARLRATLEHTKAACSQWQNHTVAAAQAAARTTDATIRENPYVSLGVAFSVGLLLGVLITRRNRHGDE